jgi:hypothetical protein
MARKLKKKGKTMPKESKPDRGPATPGSGTPGGVPRTVHHYDDDGPVYDDEIGKKGGEEDDEEKETKKK